MCEADPRTGVRANLLIEGLSGGMVLSVNRIPLGVFLVSGNQIREGRRQGPTI